MSLKCRNSRISEKKHRWHTTLEKDVFIKGLVLQYWLSSGLTTIPVNIWKDMNVLISSMYVFPFLPKQPSVGVLMKGVLKICSKFIGEHPCRSVISIKLQSNFIKITLWHGVSPVNLLHRFRTSFSRSTPGGLLLIP